MYLQTGIAKRLKPSAASAPDDLPPLPSSLAGIAKLGGAREETIVEIACDETGEFVAVLSQAELAIWSVKPCVVLCKIKRTHLSIRQYGNNAKVYWKPTQQSAVGLVVETSKSGLLHYTFKPMPHNGTAYRMPLKPTTGAPLDFQAGSGEGPDIPAMMLSADSAFDFASERISACCSDRENLLIALSEPPALLTVPWNALTLAGSKETLLEATEISQLSTFDWLRDSKVSIIHIAFSSRLNLYSFITSNGQVYIMRHIPRTSFQSDAAQQEKQNETPLKSNWHGHCVYHQARRRTSMHDFSNSTSEPQDLEASSFAVSLDFNARFSLLAAGLQNGLVEVFNVSSLSLKSAPSHRLSLRDALKSTASHLETEQVSTVAWSNDGQCVVVGWMNGYSAWSVYGRLISWAINGEMGSGADSGEGVDRPPTFEDHFSTGVQRALWIHGDFELWTLCPVKDESKNGAIDEQLFVLNFAKSAVAGIHSPDNTNHAFLQQEDRLLVYRGTDQPDMSVINPESDVWQNIKLPSQYLANNWPIGQAAISSDGRLLAVAGQYGLCHYNSLSGRWKTFEKPIEEQSFAIRGGMQWFENVLVAAIETFDTQQFKIRLYSRDRPLTQHAVLYEEIHESPVIALSIFESSLLVYTGDNTLHHYLIVIKENTHASLKFCGSIGFEGVVRDPSRVRGLSWLVPRSQQRFGDPADDLNVATVIFLIDGKLVLLRPRRAGHDEVKYDLQVLADKVEFYWTHLSGIGTLENSLWGYDGSQIRVWLNALIIDTRENSSALGLSIQPRSLSPALPHNLQPIKESFTIPIDFYPLSVLMEKGIVIGVNQETTVRRSVDFALFKITTNTHLFLHHVLRFHLSFLQTQEAVLFASCYQHLVYFAHALEILLHNVLEEEADALLASQKSQPTSLTSSPRLPSSRASTPPKKAVLPCVIDFLDHFDESLQVVVGCARKTEVARWDYLFNVVGQPRELFESCMASGSLKVAASYLLVLHSLESMEKSSEDTVRLLKAAIAVQDWALAKELLRFLFSLDHSGVLLRQALSEANALPPQYATTTHSQSETIGNVGERAVSQAQQQQSAFGIGLNFLTGR